MGFASSLSPDKQLVLPQDFAKSESRCLYSERFSAEAKHMDTSHRLARETIRCILAKVLLSAEDASTQTDVAGCPLFMTTPESGAGTENAPFKVRWLMSGSPICSVPVVPTLCVADVKELLLQRAGVPIEEQRLLHNGQELPMDGALPSPGSELLLMCSETDSCVSDLGYFHREVDFDPMPRGTFKRVRKLAEGDRTDLYRYTWQHPDDSLDEVVVRKVPSVFLQQPQSPALDERALHEDAWSWAPAAEDRLTEIGVYVPPAGQVKAVPLVAEWPASGVAMARTESGHLCEIRFPAEAKAGLPCVGEVWGYAARPVDIFAVGVSLFMLAWQCPPWKRAMLHDAHFAYVLRLGSAGFDGMLKHWRKTPLEPDAMRLITQMMEPNPRKRPSAAGCLASPWLAAAEGATGAA